MAYLVEGKVKSLCTPTMLYHRRLGIRKGILPADNLILTTRKGFLYKTQMTGRKCDGFRTAKDSVQKLNDYAGR